MLSTPIILDYQSATPCLKEVVESMYPYWTEIFANPSSKSNLASISASALLEVSREKIQNYLNIKEKKIIFTSGATEANNLALIGYARNYYKKTGNYGNIITLKTEHYAVLEPLKQLEKEGFTVIEIVPDKDGLISEDTFLKSLNEDTFLVSIMLANNEIGVCQPLKRIAEICNEKEITIHTDAAQCLGNISLDFVNTKVNMITMSSHKIYGPKGVGLLIIDENIDLQPLIMGGGQEFGFRAGTIPLPLVVGFTKAIELAVLNQEKNSKRFLIHRNNLLNGLLKNNSGIEVNGSMIHRLPNNLNITFLNVNGSLLHKKLKSKIICSSGSACSNGRPSHVLIAIGRSFREAEASLRLSVGLQTTAEEIDKSILIISNTVKSLRK